MSIYVEILVRAPMDDLWAHTQTPALHEKWDLRFSRIRYLPKHNSVWGPLFGYSGRFDVEWRKVNEVPRHILPYRQEPRE